MIYQDRYGNMIVSAELEQLSKAELRERGLFILPQRAIIK